MSDTVFVTMYDPNLGNVQVDAPLQAVSTYQAHGWLLLDPNATPPPVAAPYLTQPAGDSRYLRAWAGAEVLTAGAVRLAPDGHVIVRTADGTTRSTYDATEQALWTVIGGQTAAQLAADPALRAAYGLVVAATVTTSGALIPGKHNPVDATSGALTMTLPTGAVEGATIGVEKLDSSANAVTVTGNVRGASGQSISLPWAHETLVLRADSTGSWWPVSGHKTKTSLDAAYANPYRLRAESTLSRLAPDDNAPFATVSSDAPTVTVSTAATLTGRLVGPQGGEITEVGSRGTWDTTNVRLPVGGNAGLDFYHTGQAVEFVIFATVATYPIWIFIDGQPATAAPSSITTTTGTAFVKLAFGASRRRRIEFFCTHSGNWYGVRGAALTDSFEPAPRKPVVAWIGDSFWGGVAAATPQIQSSAFFAARYLGVECLTYALALSGTGYSTPGSFTTFGSSSRLAQLTKAAPDLIVVQGSVNDDAKGTVGADAATAYASWASALPDVPVIVTGPQPTAAGGTIGSNRQANIAAVKAAALAAPNVIGFHDQVGSASAVPPAWSGSTSYADGDKVTRYGSVWKLSNGGTGFTGGSGPAADARWVLVTWVVYGTGQVGTTVGDGNRDVLVYSDAIHPMPLASEAYGVITARKIRADLRNFARLGTVNVD